MSERAAYSRVYWSIGDDEKFVGIYDHDAHLAGWLRLLLIADQAHPASAHLPSNVRRSSVAALADAGLIDLVVGGRYRVHGLDAERERRRLAATTRGPRPPTDPSPNGHRPVPERSPDGIQTRGLRRDETRKDETRQPRESLPGDDGRADIEAYLLVTRRAPTPRQRALLDGLLQLHDLTGPQWAADIMLRHPDDPIGALIAADKEWRATRIAEAQAADVPKPRPRRRPGLPTHTRELLEHWAATAKVDDKEPAA